MPKRILLLSHTDDSKKIHSGTIGEIANSKKLEKLIRGKNSYSVDWVDLYSLFENFETDYEPLALLNYDLAENGHEPLELLDNPIYKKVFDRAAHYRPDLTLVLTWGWGISALLGSGIARLGPLVTKLYQFLPEERVITPLYQSSDLLVTECLLANKKGSEYGIPLTKMIYLPHHYPEGIEKIRPDKNYLKRVAMTNGKSLAISSKTLIIGMISRLEPRKNCGYAIQAVANLIGKGKDILFVLKGDLEENEKLPVELEYLQKQPWFLWDRESTPFPKVLECLDTLDIFLHLSGFEGASNIVVESMALGKPTIVLDASTNPYLFKGGALFVKAEGCLRLGSMPYHVPDEKDLENILTELVEKETLRKEWSEKARNHASRCFSPALTQERLPLLFEAAQNYRDGDFSLASEIQTLFEKDCERHGI